MMIVPAGVKVHLALGYTDMRKGMDGLAMLVQDTLKKDASRAICSPPGQAGADHQGPVLGRQRAVSLHQTDKNRTLTYLRMRPELALGQVLT
jgi:hypothetical protein